MEVLADVLISRGSLSEVPSYPRVVADYALRYNAHHVLFCHNHPGGSLVPSVADIGSTRKLKDMLESLEVRFIDHYVVARKQAFSMMEHHLLEVIGGEVLAKNRAANSAGEVALKRHVEKLLKEEGVEP